MNYKGIQYEYAFEFTVPVCYKPDGEYFRVVISDFMDEIRGFSGLCLENELYVNAENTNIEVDAFIEIIDNIIDITINSIKSCIGLNGEIPVPRRRVEKEDFIENFNKCKEAHQSQYYRELLEKHYNEVREFLFNPEMITQSEFGQLEPEIKYCLIVFLFYYFSKARLPKIKNQKIFKI